VISSQAQASPASPRPRASIGHPPRVPFDIPTPPLSSAAGGRGGAGPAGGVDARGAEALASQLSEAAAPVCRPAGLTCDPDRDPRAALLARVEPAGSELRLDRLDQIGHHGRAAATEGRAAHREGLLRLASAAQSVGEQSHLGLSKNAAVDSRPPALTDWGRSSDLQLTASSGRIARREGETQRLHTASPRGERGKRNSTHEE
jgi:hypothetical protein